MRDNREVMSSFMRRFHRIGHLRGYGGLKILVLHLLSDGPKNGAELMDAIDVMSRGHWKPSPGSIYPLLSKAVEENQVTKREDRKYELTDVGREEISMFNTGCTSNPDSIEGILSEIDNNLSYLEDLPDDKLTPHSRLLQNISQKINRINDTVKSTEKEA